MGLKLVRIGQGIGAPLSLRRPRCVSKERERCLCLPLRRIQKEYDAFCGNNPDHSRIRALNPFLDGRSGCCGSSTQPC